MKLHKFDWLDWASTLLCAWFLYYPKPYEILFTIILILPLVGLVLHGYSKPSFTSLITITTNEDGGTDYETANFILLPALILILRMLLDFEIEDYFGLLIKGLIALIILLFIVSFFYRDIAKNNKHQALSYFVLVGNVAIYCFAVVYGINCVYDNSPPKVYKVLVTNKSIYSGRRHTTYYLEVSSWSKNSDNDKISVAKSLYDQTKIGDSVKVDSKEGILKIPWHFVE